MNVLGFAEASADLFEPSVVVFFDAETNGLETRDLVGRELVLIVGGAPP
jgi:hypothetical protein